MVSESGFDLEETETHNKLATVMDLKGYDVVPLTINNWLEGKINLLEKNPLNTNIDVMAELREKSGEQAMP